MMTCTCTASREALYGCCFEMLLVALATADSHEALLG